MAPPSPLAPVPPGTASRLWAELQTLAPSQTLDQYHPCSGLAPLPSPTTQERDMFKNMVRRGGRSELATG